MEKLSVTEVSHGDVTNYEVRSDHKLILTLKQLRLGGWSVVSHGENSEYMYLTDLELKALAHAIVSIK